MRRGIVFSVAAIFLFVSLIIASTNINLRIDDENRFINEEIPERIDRDVYDTISRDVARLFKTKVSTLGNVTINEVMPNNISKAINDYEIFLKNIFYNQSSSNISLVLKEEALYVSNFTKIFYGINKSWFNLTSNVSINYFSLRINASSVVNVTLSDWVWTANGTYVNLSIKDLSGSLALINGSRSGYVNSSRLNIFSITYTNGKVLEVKLGTNLLVNATLPINTSTTLGINGEVYTGHVLRIKNSILNLTKEYKTIVR